jgi:hypothetical protein
MTFELHDLSRQLDVMVGYLAETQPDREERAAQAMAAFDAVCADWQGTRSAVEDSRLGYLAALPEEDPGAFFPPPALEPGFSVAATDGSQIEPERHHIAEFFVLNVGWAVLHYGDGAHAELGNAPQVRFRSDELWFEVDGRRIPIRAELLAVLRSVLERRKLADLLEAIPAERTALGLADGSLLDWTLETRADDLPPEVQEDMLAQFDRIRASGHLLASYVSRPASRDVANLARVPLCSDRPAMDCRHCSSRAAKGVADCDAVDGLHDAALLWQRRLPPYHRSALFRPRQRVQERYGDHRIRCFYINAGPEIGRVEVPEWIAADVEKLGRTHALVADQCRRGRFHGRLPGYPPALVEAHEQAVLDGNDRLVFEEMLERRLVRAGLPAEISAKRRSKQMKAV